MMLGIDPSTYCGHLLNSDLAWTRVADLDVLDRPRLIEFPQHGNFGLHE